MSTDLKERERGPLDEAHNRRPQRFASKATEFAGLSEKYKKGVKNRTMNINEISFIAWLEDAGNNAPNIRSPSSVDNLVNKSVLRQIMHKRHIYLSKCLLFRHPHSIRRAPTNSSFYPSLDIFYTFLAVYVRPP